MQAKTLLAQFVRYRGKINIQRPRPPCYEKARIIEATKPIYMDKMTNVPCIANIKKHLNGVEIENPYERLIAKEAKNWFDSSKTILFFHQNSIASEDQFNAKVAFHKNSMTYKVYSRKILSLALEGSKFEGILPFFTSHNSIVFSPHIDISPVLKIVKKIPQMILLAGIIEMRFLNKDEIIQVSKTPSLQICLSQLVQTLDSTSNNFVGGLQSHQSQLVSLLDTHSKS